MATTVATTSTRPKKATSRQKPFYSTLWGQVLVAAAIAIVLGYLRPSLGIAMRPLGDGFIRLITMIISVVIFCTVVTGIAGMEDLKRIGRVGGKALLYFEVVSTIALAVGMLVGNLVRPGAGFNIDPATLDAKAVANFAGQARAQNVTDFLLNIIPATTVDAFARGNILQVVLVALLFGFGLSMVGARAKPVADFVAALTHAVFGIVNILMRLAPIGVFGAMAFTVGQYGIASVGLLAKLIVTFWVTSILFVLIVLGAVGAICGFSIVKFLRYIKEEIVIVLGVSSSDPVMPMLMRKMESLGCSKPLVGLIVPTGYMFNPDGSAIYMTMAAMFVAQATNTPLTVTQQLTIFAVALLTSKGAAGVQGAAFIALVGTLMVVPTIPVAGMAVILGIDRFMSMCRATVNVIGNGVATLAVARWEGEIDAAGLRAKLATPSLQEAATVV